MSEAVLGILILVFKIVVAIFLTLKLVLVALAGVFVGALGRSRSQAKLARTLGRAP